MPCDMWQLASGWRDTCRTRGEPCVHLHVGGLVYGFGSDMCHTHGMLHACHVEVKWLMDWLYIWTSSSVHGSAARRKEKGKKEERKGGGEPELTSRKEQTGRQRT